MNGQVVLHIITNVYPSPTAYRLGLFTSHPGNALLAHNDALLAIYLDRLRLSEAGLLGGIIWIVGVYLPPGGCSLFNAPQNFFWLVHRPPPPGRKRSFNGWIVGVHWPKAVLGDGIFFFCK